MIVSCVAYQDGKKVAEIATHSDSLFAVLHIVEPVDGEFRVGEVAIFTGPNYVLTVRSHATKGFQEGWKTSLMPSSSESSRHEAPPARISRRSTSSSSA